MSQETGKPKYIIVLGTTYSGSGAVYDYLAGRGDLHDPLDGEEYQLPQVPNGLMALEAAAGKAFHPAVADYALVQFENVVKKLSRPSSKWLYGKSYDRKIPGFGDAIAQFVDEVSTAHLPMRLDWHRLMQSRFSYIMGRVMTRFSLHQSPPETRLLVCQEELRAAAQNLHDRLFLKAANRYPVLLNQAGSGWNPVESTKYFSSCGVVLVTRDPCDQFVDIRKHKKAARLEGFIDWYNAMESRLAEVSDSRLLRVRFEDFVHSHDQIVRKICDHLRLPPDVESTYQVELSRKNVGLYRSSLDKREADIIKRAVGKAAENV